MRFLSDTHKTAAFVFSEFNVKVLTFDLEFFRDNDVIHDDWEGCRWKPYDILSGRIEGRILVNDTKALSGKQINFRPKTLICNPEANRLNPQIHSATFSETWPASTIGN